MFYLMAGYVVLGSKCHIEIDSFNTWQLVYVDVSYFDGMTQTAMSVTSYVQRPFIHGLFLFNHFIIRRNHRLITFLRQSLFGSALLLANPAGTEQPEISARHAAIEPCPIRVGGVAFGKSVSVHRYWQEFTFSCHSLILVD